jgi:hypothetical protein
VPDTRFATALIRCRWHGAYMAEDEVRGDDLTDSVLTQSIESLNGRDLTDLYLQGPGEAHMAVAGGPDGLVVYATRDNESFFSLCRRGDVAEGAIEVVAGGQAGDYPARRVVDCDTAKAAALHWMRHGEPNPSLGWEST